MDPDVADRVIGMPTEDIADYASNTIRPTYPDGLNVEAFTFAALERAWGNAQAGYEREHVTPHLWLHPKQFRLRSVEGESDLSNLRWTVDTPEDLAFARAVYERLGLSGHLFRMQEILDLVNWEPELLAINGHVECFGTHARECELALKRVHS